MAGSGAAWTNAGIFSIGTNAGGSGSVTISHDGALNSGGAVRLASNATANGRLIIGADEGNSAVAGGSLNANLLEFGSGSGTLVFNHTWPDLLFSATINSTGPGTHSIKHLTGTTRFTAATSTFNGTTELTGGRIILGTPTTPGALGGLINVRGGTSLSGTGVAGIVGAGMGVNIFPNASINPGHSIGTLHVHGAYTQQAGAVYNVELNPNNNVSDLIAVTGIATLNPGALLSVSKGVPGNYTPDVIYTILTSTGGRTGTFTADGDMQVSAFLRLEDFYDVNNAYLRVVQIRDPSVVPITPNEKETNGGQTPGTIIPLLNARTDPEARDALNQMSGVNHASLRGGIISETHIPRDLTIARMRDAFCVFNRRMLPDEDPRRHACEPSKDQYTYWGAMYGSYGRVAGDGNAAKLSTSGAGLLTGVDTRLGDNWRGGLLAGYTRGQYSTNEVNGVATTDAYRVGGYLGAQWDRLGLRLGSIYSWYDINSSRTIRLPNFMERVNSQSYSGTAQAFVELGYKVDTPVALLEPYLNATYVNLHSQGFTETRAMTALNVGSDTTNHGFFTLGLRGIHDTQVNGKPVTVHADLGWRHALTGMQMALMQMTGGRQFYIAGVAIERDVATLQAGFDVQLTDDAVFNMTYGGVFGQATLDQSIRAKFALAF